MANWTHHHTGLRTGRRGQSASPFYLTLGPKDTPVSGEASLLIQDGRDGGAHPELSGAA
jgi:hypothetical protein